MSDLVWVSHLQRFLPRKKADAKLSYRGPRKNRIVDENFRKPSEHRKGMFRSH